MAVLADLVDADALGAAPPRLRALLDAVSVPDRVRGRFKTRFSALSDWGFSRTETSGHIALGWRGTAEDIAAYHWLILSSSGGSRGQPQPFGGTRNAALIAGPLLARSMSLSGTARHLIVHVPASAIPAVLADGTPFESERGPGAILAAVVRAVEREATSIHPHAIQPTLAALTGLIGAALAARDTAAMGSHRTAPGDRIADHLELHFDDPSLSAAAVAQACGLSLRQLHRAFADTGESFGETVRRLRFARSLDLLARGEPVADVAEACGFADPGYFATAFRRRFGCAPTAWRADPR
jgi:AraC-like DNA-binding protein